MEVSFVTALLGGMLALLSPCGALLLPAFFASAAVTRARLAVMALLFWAGLCVTLVPLGLGAGLLGSALARSHGLVVAGTALLLVVLGVWQIAGGGGRLIPRLQRQRQVVRTSGTATGLAQPFLLGATGGAAGFCAGPILGAILTLAAAQGDVVRAGVLLVAYGFGMVMPLTVIAALWERLGDRGRRLLRGRPIALGPLRVHSTALVSGLLMIAVGVLFWATDGLLSLPSLVPSSVADAVVAASSVLPPRTADAGTILAGGAIGVALWWVATRERPDARAGADAGAEASGGADASSGTRGAR